MVDRASFGRHLYNKEFTEYKIRKRRNIESRGSIYSQTRQTRIDSNQEINFL